MLNIKTKINIQNSEENQEVERNLFSCHRFHILFNFLPTVFKFGIPVCMLIMCKGMNHRIPSENRRQTHESGNISE